MPEPLYQLPFLTRDMFPFGKTAKIEIEIDFFGGGSDDLLLRVLTKEAATEHRIVVANNTSREVFTRQISDFPVMMSLSCAQSFVNNRGDTYATVYLKVNGVRINELCRGYVYDEGGISFPQGRYEPQLEGGGDIKVLTQTSAAGANFSHTIENNMRARLMSVRGILTTDANVATRQVHFQIQSSTSVVLFDIPAPITQTAGLVRNYNFIPVGQAPTTLIDSDIVVPIPHDIILEDGMKIVSAITNIQVGDDWGNTMIYSERYRCSFT